MHNQENHLLTLGSFLVDGDTDTASRIDPYRISTGFPFSRIQKSSKIRENLFDSRQRQFELSSEDTTISKIALKNRACCARRELFELINQRVF